MQHSIVVRVENDDGNRERERERERERIEGVVFFWGEE